MREVMRGTLLADEVMKLYMVEEEAKPVVQRQDPQREAA
jgi:hypothetical protein